MFDHNAVSSTDKHEKAAIAVIAPVASFIVMVVVVRVMIPSDIATTAKWFGETFESTVSPDALPAGIVSTFGNPAYPLEGNALGLLLTAGVLVLMVAMARAGKWFPNENQDMMWTSAIWGLVKREYNASALNSQKLSLFITTVIVMGADLYTDVLGKTTLPVSADTLPEVAVFYLSASVKLFVITNVLSEMFMFASAGVFFTSIANLFDQRKMPKVKRPDALNRSSGKGQAKQQAQRPTPGNEPGRTSPTRVPSYAQQRTAQRSTVPSYAQQRPTMATGVTPRHQQDRNQGEHNGPPEPPQINFDLDLDTPYIQ